MTPAEAMRLVALLVDVLPPQRMSAESIDMYALFLSDFELEAGTAAVVDWIATERKFPPIADLRDRYYAMTGALGPDVDQAWREVERQVGAVGTNGSPKFSHEAIADAVASIGWRTICQSTQVSIERAHFIRFYESVRRRHVRATVTVGAKSIARQLQAVVEGAPAIGAPPPRRGLKGGGS